MAQMSGTYGAPFVSFAGAEAAGAGSSEAEAPTRILTQQAQQQRAHEQALQLQRVQASLAELLDGLNCPIRWGVNM